MISPVYSVAKLAKLSGMSQHRLRRWIVEKRLKVYTYSGVKQLFRLEDLQAAQKAAREAEEQKREAVLGVTKQSARQQLPRKTKTIDEIFS